jgi:hypothetical protein
VVPLGQQQPAPTLPHVVPAGQHPRPHGVVPAGQVTARPRNGRSIATATTPAAAAPMARSASRRVDAPPIARANESKRSLMTSPPGW